MLLLVLLLILWPSSILGLLLLKLAELESRGWRIYRGNAAEVLVGQCYFENLLLMLKLTFGKCDQIVDFGGFGT